EGEVAQPSERVLDVLAEDREEQHVAEDVVPAAVHEDRGQPAEAPGLGAVARAVDGARVERGVEDRRAQVRQLVEDPHREVGREERDVDDREAPRRDAVGERDHRGSSILISLVTPVTPYRLATRLKASSLWYWKTTSPLR